MMAFATSTFITVPKNSKLPLLEIVMWPVQARLLSKKLFSMKMPESYVLADGRKQQLSRLQKIWRKKYPLICCIAKETLGMAFHKIRLLVLSVGASTNGMEFNRMESGQCNLASTCMPKLKMENWSLLEFIFQNNYKCLPSQRLI